MEFITTLAVIGSVSFEKSGIIKINNLRNLIFILALSLPIFCFSNTDSTMWKLRLNPCKIGIGYIYQGEHLFETGLKLEYIQKSLNKKTRGENVSILLGGQISKNNKSTYLNPFATLRYLKPINKTIGVKLSISYNWRQINTVISQSITPEIGLNFNRINTISYGYNLFIDNKYSWVAKNRVALRIMLF